jgi:hypothetical protein
VVEVAGSGFAARRSSLHAALHEVEARPPKSDIGPSRQTVGFAIARPGGEKGGVSLVESTSLLVLLVNG